MSMTDTAPPPTLAESLRELGEVFQVARDEGWEVPSRAAVDHTRRILLAMHEILPMHYDVGPSPDGTVVITTEFALEDSVDVDCLPDGSAWCITEIAGVWESEQYESSDALPNEFLARKLRAIRLDATK